MKSAPLALLLMQCATAGPPVPPPTHYAVYADDVSIEATAAAVDAWQATGAVTLDLIEGPCPPPQAEATICVHVGTLGPDVGGLTLPRPATDSADVTVLVGTTAPIVEHELGHAMRLEHTGPGTVMCHETGCMSPGVTAADVAQFRAVRGEGR